MFGIGIDIGLGLRSRKIGTAAVLYFTDIYGMPGVIYSLRKLSPLSTNCVRVRRSSDNAEENIGFTATAPNSPINTAALLSFVGAGDGFITTWYDQSTNVKNSVQTTLTNQPKIVSAGALINVNSKPSILFDGSNDFMPSTFQVNDVGTIAVQLVDKLNNISLTQMTLTANEGPNQQIYMDYVTANNYSNYYCQQSNTTAANTNQSLSSFYMGNLGGGFYRNNVLAYAPPIQKFGTSNTFTIGKYSGGGLNANVNIQEIIVWNVDKQTSRIAIESNINSYYNVF